VTDPSYLPPDPTDYTVTSGTESTLYSEGPPGEGRKRKNVLPPPPPPPPVDSVEPSSISYADILRKPSFVFSESYSETDLLSDSKNNDTTLHSSCPDLTSDWSTTHTADYSTHTADTRERDVSSTLAGLAWSSNNISIDNVLACNNGSDTNGASGVSDTGFNIEFLNESSLSPRTVGEIDINSESLSKDSVVFSSELDNRDSIRNADSIFIESRDSDSTRSEQSTISYTHSAGIHYTTSDSTLHYSPGSEKSLHYSGSSDNGLCYSGSEKGYSSVGISEGYTRERKMLYVPKYKEQRRGPVTVEHQRLINYFSKEWRYIERITKKQVYKNSY